ncbi:phage portal protein [Microbacterium allomyrinae]|uniref:Phage portal protein n=1 Tax=Microbacterium allomyrinae TaxID=2830666 RepID=A0A9X1LR96_9MICO|nr:phage portal protein [Microbacterium allomyrinae]MCC2030622.1 phage portal protein [Microbacterium allomyrinae]
MVQVSLFTRPETRDLTAEDAFGPSWQSLGRGGAMRQAAAYAAVRYIADQWAQSAITVTELRGDQREPVATPPILADPSPILSVWDSRVIMTTELKNRGNAYSIVDDSRRYCQWLPDGYVTVDSTNPFKPVYRLLGRPIDLVKRGGNLLHIREMVDAGGVEGMSPIQQFAASFEWSDLARQYGRRYLKNSSMPPAILQAKGSRLDADKLREARDEFVEAAKEGKPVALPGEWDYRKITITPEEAQFLQTIEASATEIAIIYGVPPEEVGGKAGSSRTYSNREMDQALFRIKTLGGVSGRAEAAFPDVLRDGLQVVYDLSRLERPGILEFARTITEQLRNGTLTLSEARRELGRRGLNTTELEQWQQWYATTKSESESLAESIATSITKEAP